MVLSYRWYYLCITADIRSRHRWLWDLLSPENIGDGMTLSNDAETGSARASVVEAQGAVALLLVEGLLHTLVETRRLPLNSALSIIEGALEVQAECDHDDGIGPEVGSHAIGLLQKMQTTFITGYGVSGTATGDND